MRVMKTNFSNFKSIIHWVGFFLFLASLGACSIFKHKKTEKPLVLLYPSPPDQPRFQYLTKITSSKDLGDVQTHFSKMILGEIKAATMTKPYGLAIRKGKIYVCDNYAGGMEVLDLDRKKFNFFNPAGKGHLKMPINCFIDEKGYLYVGDCGRFEVVVFDEKGNYVRSFGEKEKFKPSDVAVANGKVFVANSANSQIDVYSNDSASKFLYTIPKIGATGEEHICMPTNITIHDSTLYVSDFGCSKIRMYTLNGQFLDTLGGRGDFLGQFAKVKGIAVDHDKNIYAVDAAFENVQIFDKDKHILMPLGNHYKGPGDLYLPAKVVIDYDNLKYFQKFVDPAYDLKYLVIVTNQYGPDLITIYGRIEPKTNPNKK